MLLTRHFEREAKPPTSLSTSMSSFSLILRYKNCEKGKTSWRKKSVATTTYRAKQISLGAFATADTWRSTTASLHVICLHMDGKTLTAQAQSGGDLWVVEWVGLKSSGSGRCHWWCFELHFPVNTKLGHAYRNRTVVSSKAKRMQQPHRRTKTKSSCQVYFQNVYK